MRLRPSSLTCFIVAAFALGAAARADAQPGPKHVSIHVDSVLAAESNEGMDPKLGSMGQKLQGLFSYTSYRLENRQEAQTECGKMLTFTLPGGHILHVQPRAIDGDMIAMEIVLFDGARPMMTTDLKLKDNGTLIVGGPHYKEGMLIISIGASTGEARIAVHPQIATPAEDTTH